MNWYTLFKKEILEKGYALCFEEDVVTSYQKQDNVISAIVNKHKVEIVLNEQNAMLLKCDCENAKEGNRCKHQAALMYEWEYHTFKEEKITNYTYSESVYMLEEIKLCIKEKKYEKAFYILKKVMVQLNRGNKQNLMQNAMCLLDEICENATLSFKEEIKIWLLEQLKREHKAFLDEIFYECYLKHYSDNTAFEIRIAIVDRKIKSAIKGDCGDFYLQVLMNTRVMLMEENDVCQEEIDAFINSFNK